jgi:hypothetical protein
MEQKLVFLLFIGVGFLIFVRNAIRAADGDDLSVLERADDEFRALIVDVSVPELCFDGRTAQIVDERHDGVSDRGTGCYTLQRVRRFARNAHGEYFFFISEGTGKPYFKHVTQANAKLELGKKYIAPPPSPHA